MQIASKGWFVALLLGLLPLSGARAAPNESVKTPQARVTLVSEREGIAPGVDTLLGISFEMEPSWHIYWKNPGDSGLPPRADWSASSEVGDFGALEFPIPEMTPFKTQMNFAYPKTAFLIVPFRPSADLVAGSETKIELKLKWLICREECLPGKADLTLKLPVVSKLDFASLVGTHSVQFKKAQAALPKRLEKNVAVRADAGPEGGGIVTIDFPVSAPAAEGFQFFPEEDLGTNLFDPVRPEKTATGFRLRMTQKNFRAVGSAHGLFRSPATGAREFSSDGFRPTFAEVKTEAGAGVNVVVADSAVSEPAAPQSLAVMLLFAFIGGLILNLMPCILPVLSIKVMGLVHQAGEGKKSIRAHGLSFTFGVLVSFWILAAILIGVRSSGATLGWGFQLQNPIFMALLSLLFYFMGLNLLGYFEIGDRWMGFGQSLTMKQEYVGSFFTGVLTTVAATPCSAPFMGTALGFALTQSSAIAFLVLTVLGFGLAFPYLLFSFLPQASRLLPRPGKWMLTFKEFLGFPLFGTAIWMLTILMRQAGADATLATLRVGLTLTFLIWIVRRTGVLKWILTVAALALVVHDGVALATFKNEVRTESSSATNENARLSRPWKHWTRARMEKSLAEGKTVFINATADWCVTCKVNESVIFSQERVKVALGSENVDAYIADWTTGDAELTAYLEANGRNSVPVYLVYRNGAKKPEMLPQVFAAERLLKAISE